MKHVGQEPSGASTKSPELVDWRSPQEQQFLFDRFAWDEGDDSIKSTTTITGLRFQEFQEFLSETLYRYFAKFPPRGSSQEHSEHDHNGNTNGHHQVPDSNGNKPSRTAHECSSSSEVEDALGKLDIEGPRSSQGRFTKQQEMHLFRKFDQKNDHVIDRDEFANLCQKWLHQVFNPMCALVIVDVQNDFIDGSLALINGPAGQDGAEVVPVINDLVDTCHQYATTIVYTQDWHPQDHVSFHDNLYLRKYTIKGSEPSAQEAHGTSTDEEDRVKQENKKKTESHAAKPTGQEQEFKYKKFAHKAKLFDTVLFDEGRIEQKLWPTHCVNNSWGAQLHPKLKIAPDSIKIQKGTLSHVDAYSAFWDNMRLNETGLRQELIAKGATDLFFCGLALDYCVAASALDAAKAGFITFVVEDACRGIDIGEMEKRKQELRDHGAFLVQSNLVESYVRKNHPYQASSQHPCLDCDLIKTITYRKAFS